MINKIITNPHPNQWKALQQRPSSNNKEVTTLVENIITSIKTNGDAAVLQYNKTLDNNTNTILAVTKQEIDTAITQVPQALKEAIEVAYNNITTFHTSQLQTTTPVITTMPGINCWRKSIAIDTVGLYIPGGTAPLFSTVLMLGIPASLAGCTNIVLCTPTKNDDPIHPAILYCASLCGITQIYKVGGAVAIAAMAYGTATIPQVHKIFGPGNQYVTIAKQLIQQNGIAIDMPAGPSEVCILADETANPKFVASDLLAQAEHGSDSQVLLVCTHKFDIDALQQAITAQLAILPRAAMALQTLANSTIFIFTALPDALLFVNLYAAEHLIICTKDAAEDATKITNAGSIFIGNYSPESVGDYASGTNHTLPTNGFATAYSGVSIDSFVKKITYQQLSAQGLQNIASCVITMANAEGLQAHANSVQVRLNQLNTL